MHKRETHEARGQADSSGQVSTQHPSCMQEQRRVDAACEPGIGYMHRLSRINGKRENRKHLAAISTGCVRAVGLLWDSTSRCLSAWMSARYPEEFEQQGRMLISRAGGAERHIGHYCRTGAEELVQRHGEEERIETAQAVRLFSDLLSCLHCTPWSHVCCAVRQCVI